MVVNCEHVWREISNYLEGEVDADLRAAIEEHIRGCKRCHAVLDGTRNVIELYGDERALEIPVGFSQRLHRRLEAQMPRPRGSAFGWMVAFAAACLLIAAFTIARVTSIPPPPVRSEHAAPAVHVPPDMMVVVYDAGKSFHAANCSLLHGKEHLRVIPASLAIKEGFGPCPRCMKRYLGTAELEDLLDDRMEIAEAVELR